MGGLYFGFDGIHRPARRVLGDRQSHRLVGKKETVYWRVPQLDSGSRRRQ